MVLVAVFAGVQGMRQQDQRAFSSKDSLIHSQLLGLDQESVVAEANQPIPVCRKDQKTSVASQLEVLQRMKCLVPLVYLVISNVILLTKIPITFFSK